MKPHYVFLCLVLSACAAHGSVPQQFSVDKPDRLYVESQERHFNFQLHRVLTGAGEGWFKEEHGEYWSDGNGGNGENLHTVISQPLSEPPSTDVCHQTFDWAPSSWPTLVDATLVKSPLACDSFWGTGGYPLIDKIYCDIPANKFDQYFPGDWIHTECSWHTETRMSLYTGGKALPRRMNLFVLTGSAMEITEKYTPPVYSSKSYRTIASTKVVIGDLGALGNDGRRYAALPDGATHDVTPRVKSKNYYSFLLDSSKHKPYITANGHNLVDEKPEFCVGQKVTFALAWDSTPDYVDMVGRWKIPDKFVNESWQHERWIPGGEFGNPGYWQPYGSVNYRINDSLLLDTIQTSCWFVNVPGGQGRVSVGTNLRFSNGQTASVAVNGDFSVVRPILFPVEKLDTPYGGKISVEDDNYWLDLTSNAMHFKAYISKTHRGSFGLTQLVKMYSQTGRALPPFINWHSTDGDFWLDGSDEFYDSKSVELPDGSWPSNDRYDIPCELADAPGLELGVLYGFYDGQWKTYVRFTPIESGSIPVTLGRIDWNWDSVANTADGVWQVTADTVIDPDLHEDDSFPEWTDVKPSPRDDNQ